MRCSHNTFWINDDGHSSAWTWPCSCCSRHCCCLRCWCWLYCCYYCCCCCYCCCCWSWYCWPNWLPGRWSPWRSWGRWARWKVLQIWSKPVFNHSKQFLEIGSKIKKPWEMIHLIPFLVGHFDFFFFFFFFSGGRSYMIYLENSHTPFENTCKSEKSKDLPPTYWHFFALSRT